MNLEGAGRYAKGFYMVPKGKIAGLRAHSDSTMSQPNTVSLERSPVSGSQFSYL